MRAALLATLVLFAGCLSPPGGEPDDMASALTQDELRARRLLTNVDDDRVAMHAYYVAGREPNVAAMAWLAGRIQEVTGKLEVRVEPFTLIDTGPTSRDNNWTGHQTDLVFASLDVPSRPRTFPLVFLFLDGYGYSSAFGSTAQGWADNDYIAMFPDTIRGVGLTEPVRASVPLPDPEGAGDRRVLLHEVGHMLGLVDNGAPMVRAHVAHDDPCKCHSSNPESIMAVNVDIVTTARSVIEPRDFDQDDLADLRAVQQAART